MLVLAEPTNKGVLLVRCLFAKFVDVAFADKIATLNHHRIDKKLFACIAVKGAFYFVDFIHVGLSVLFVKAYDIFLRFFIFMQRYLNKKS